jgi:hypothetical protein
MKKFDTYLDGDGDGDGDDLLWHQSMKMHTNSPLYALSFFPCQTNTKIKWPSWQATIYTVTFCNSLCWILEFCFGQSTPVFMTVVLCERQTTVEKKQEEGE